MITIVIDAVSLDQSRKDVFVSSVTIVLTHNYLDSPQKNSNKTVFLQRNKKNIDAYYMGRKLLISDNDEQTFRKILLKEKFESQIYNKKHSCFIKNTLFQSNYKNVKQPYWRPMRYTAPFNEEFIFRFFFYSLSTGIALYIIKTKVAMKKQKCRFIIFKCFIALTLSVIFAVLHKPDHNDIGLLSVTTMSLFAFYLVDRSKGMLLPISLHFISNWLGFIGVVSFLSAFIHSNT